MSWKARTLKDIGLKWISLRGWWGSKVFKTILMVSRGFTLIEVVVAIAILGIGLVTIIELFSGGLRLERTAGEYTKAVGYARMKMEEISVNEHLQEGMFEGEFDPDYRWRVGVKKVEILPVDPGMDFKPPVELYQIKVDVFWKSAAKEKSTEIESFKTIQPEANEETG